MCDYISSSKPILLNVLNISATCYWYIARYNSYLDLRDTWLDAFVHNLMLSQANKVFLGVFMSHYTDVTLPSLRTYDSTKHIILVLRLDCDRQYHY